MSSAVVSVIVVLVGLGLVLGFAWSVGAEAGRDFYRWARRDR